MPIQHLDQAQTLAFNGEMVSTRNLLGYGTKVLREARFIETARDPIMTMLSIGVEKLLKLTLGVLSLDQTQRWPSKAQMMEIGHGVTSLYESVFQSIELRAAESTEYVKGLVHAVGADPVLQPLLDVLDRYGRAGRFYNLDLLADRPQEGDDPNQMWGAAEEATLHIDRLSHLREIATSHLSDNEAWDDFYLAVQGEVADTIDRLWGMLCAAGVNGVLGDTGRTFGFEVARRAIGRQ